MRTGTITLSIDSQLDHVFLIGQAVNKICTSIRLGEQAAYEAEVSVVEAVNNVIQHAYQNQPGHRVEVVVTVTEDSIMFKVCDQGVPRKRMRVRLPPVDERNYRQLAEGGRGLFIMRAFTDKLSYGRDGDRNVLTLVKRLPDEMIEPSAQRSLGARRTRRPEKA